MVRLNSVDELNQEVIKRIINQFQMNELPRLMKLKNYYLNKTAILNRVRVDSTQPNNKVVHPFAQYITDTLTGYFMGEPVAYTSNENIEALKLVYEYNDEQNENMELAKSCSIFGKAWEYLYVDLDGSLRFTYIDPREIIPIYGTSINDDLLAVIRFYEEYNVVKDAVDVIVEVYTDTEIYTYKTEQVISNLELVSVIPHAIGSVPFVLYMNNEDMTGDFEGVISLIDAYDALVSDDLNDFEYFCDAYLALYGYTADNEDAKQMKENRILCLDTGSKAEWLIKQGDGASVEQTKARIETDIHKFSKTPNANDESFSSNTSGVAMKYKLLGTENLGSIKESKFKKGLQRRMEIISHLFELTRRPKIDWLGVDIIFTRNLPVNEADIANMVEKLDGIVSKKTLVAQLPFVDDAEQEVERLQGETKANIIYTAGFGYQEAQEEEVAE